jgi:hypothetical protein
MVPEMITEERTASPEPLLPRAPLPPLRRTADRAPFEHPAFASAVAAAFDHVIDNKLPELSFADTEQLCRLFLVHFIALGGTL